MTILKRVFLVVLVTVLLPVQGLADRLYTWTDDKGVSHITQTPPPAGARQKDVIDYSHRTHKEQQAASASKAEEAELRKQAEEVLTRPKGDLDQYREEIRKEVQRKAAEGKQTCNLQAPGKRVYVRVFSTNSYSEREQEIWKGWIEPYQQATIISPTRTIIFSRRWKEREPFSGDSLRPCSGGGVIQIPAS